MFLQVKIRNYNYINSNYSNYQYILITYNNLLAYEYCSPANYALHLTTQRFNITTLGIRILSQSFTMCTCIIKCLSINWPVLLLKRIRTAAHIAYFNNLNICLSRYEHQHLSIVLAASTSWTGPRLKTSISEKCEAT